jgi:hypothetical protein
MGLGGFLMVAIEYIAFACYPPRSETSHDGGLVDLFSEAHKSHVLAHTVDCQLIHQGDTLKETEESTDCIVYVDVCTGM